MRRKVCGTEDVDIGSWGGTVTLTTFPREPQSILLTVESPEENGQVIVASLVDKSASGFSYVLSGVPEVSGFKLNYIATFAIT